MRIVKKLLCSLSKRKNTFLGNGYTVEKSYGCKWLIDWSNSVDKKMACVIGERILKTVKNREFKIDETGELFKITVSIGIAIFPDNGKSRHDILALADQMMYLAKSSGRGQVKMALEILERR